jgi:hypothetical protein
MSNEVSIPFSARNKGSRAQIDNDFPESARMGLMHILQGLLDRNFLENYRTTNAELERIARVPPSLLKHSDQAQALISMLPWDKCLDFCERMYSHLATDVAEYNGMSERLELIHPKIEVQEYVTQEVQRLLLEENLAFEFSNGLIRRKGRRFTAEQVARAEVVLGDPRLHMARGHINKALRYFRNVAQPDPENVVKEAVCAVEATARALFPAGGNTLGEVTKSITGSGPDKLPKVIANTIHGLYGLRNSGDGVGHGGSGGGPITKEIAEYALALASSQIVLLVDFERNLEPEVPF